MSIDPLEFRNVIGHFATGVTVITTGDGDELHGMTANSVTSLSLDPVMLLICVDKTSHTWRMLEASGAFTVNILGAHQEDVSRAFAKKGEPEIGSLRGFPFVRGRTGTPRLEDCRAFVECKVAEVLDGGDHSIFLGEVVDEGIVTDGPPLIFYRGRYATIDEPA